MKILLSSYVFSPSVGGIETVTALLAPEFVKAGHEVVLMTQTKEEDGISRPFAVERNPSWRRLLELVRWCDVYFQNNISLSLAWPLLLVRKPWIIAHHTWLGPGPGQWNRKARLKQALLKLGTNATISRPMAADLPVPATVVGNPFATETFKLLPHVPRDRELIFVGRLVSDKGVDLLIEALSQLRQQGLHPRLTIIGSGPEADALEQLAQNRGVAGQINFVGRQKTDDIAQLLNAHQILVVPSRWPEPFGLVALEGIACGCVVVAAQTGGLPEAMGTCGLTFAAGDATGLAEQLHKLLGDPALRDDLRRGAEEHLRQFAPATVAAKYLALFAQALNSDVKAC